jgi:hypothetical protein
MSVKSTGISFKKTEPVTISDGISTVEEGHSFPGTDKKAERSYGEHPQFLILEMKETGC